jgi:hypothetical protein
MGPKSADAAPAAAIEVASTKEALLKQLKARARRTWRDTRLALTGWAQACWESLQEKESTDACQALAATLGSKRLLRHKDAVSRASPAHVRLVGL